MFLILSLACVGDPQDTAVSEPELEYLFSFAVIADPHISSGLEHQERLAGAVDWVNQQDVELVWVVGDIGWNEGLPIARALLDELTAPYIPIIGDNEVHIGPSEEAFDQTFADHYALLASEYPDFQRGAVEVHHPEFERTVWLQNLSFSHRGLRWVGLDWNSRDDDALLGEFGHLNDMDGGTLPFLADQLGPLEPLESEDVLLFSHHPMHLGAFNLAQMDELVALTGPIQGRVAGAYAGHLHATAQVEVDDGGYTAFVTDATWDDDNTVRIVEVWGNGQRFAYEQHLEVVPW